MRLSLYPGILAGRASNDERLASYSMGTNFASEKNVRCLMIILFTFDFV